MDFESWRCSHDERLFCPAEGCPKDYGCARDRGWKPGDPSPPECCGEVPLADPADRVS